MNNEILENLPLDTNFRVPEISEHDLLEAPNHLQIE